MTTKNWEHASILVNYLERLEPNVKQKFNFLLELGHIDIVLWEMIQLGFLPEWIKKELRFNMADGRLEGLREILELAVSEFFLGKDERGCYVFLDFSDEELAGMSHHVGLDDKDVACVSEKINNRLSIFI